MSVREWRCRVLLGQVDTVVLFGGDNGVDLRADRGVCAGTRAGRRGDTRVDDRRNDLVRETDVAARIAKRALAKRETDYIGEVRALLDAALTVMRERATTAKPRVADIVAVAGLSNDAFYRHFRSKDALVAALLEDGTQRLTSYVTHRMGKADTPRAKVRRWVESILSQAAEDTAATTRAVLWNGSSLAEELSRDTESVDRRLAALLLAPLRELGSPRPESDAQLLAHMLVGVLRDHLWRGVAPTDADVERITEFCVNAVR
ncbi:TetR/AcrR family transcriptional regulator [Nocardia callitridis]|uniref:HTH tetR-type domain-containing protein n=1 Tax=Nocardia callitridis TaxID=648753 RepID=A0ABP9KMS5_9NOCA